MFCDLADSTPLSQRLDPEELREVLRAFQREASRPISEYGGHVARYMGDGMLVYFGYPQAHEDDGRRAVHAGLGILQRIDALRAYYAEDERIELNVRVGIHTGLVVMAEMGSGERLEPGDIVGETPNVAARLQAEAEPNTVVISDATYRLVEGYFNAEPLGERLLKGVDLPVVCYRVIGESGATTRLDVAAAKGLTPFVGREAELEMLRARWIEATRGASHTVIISGEAGIGKSRLLRELKEVARQSDHVTLELRCSHLRQNTALYPVIEQSQRMFQFRPGDSVEVKLEKVVSLLSRFGVPMNEAVPHFSSLLSLPTPPGYETAQFSPERQKHKTFDFSVQMLADEASRHPVLLIVEDLHWVDPTTLELLGQLIDRIEGMQVLLIMTCRPEFLIPWPAGEKLSVLSLGRLSSEQTRAVTLGAVGGKSLPPDILNEIASRTEGVPLFIEELTSMIIEAGLVEDLGDHYRSTGTLTPLAIPQSLHDSLMARLDHMARVKDVAQLAATLGREFSYVLIRAVSPLSETDLQESLNQLTQHGIIYPVGSRPNLRYAFKHALIQEAAYQSLLRSTRQTFHRNTVAVLEANFPDIVENEPELMAHHYGEAGFTEQAIEYWQKAADRAMQKSANIEARSHLVKASSLLQGLPETRERMQLELQLQMALGPVIGAVKGISDPEMRQSFVRARELCKQLGDGPELLPVLWGLWLYYDVRAEHAEAMEIGRECLRVAQAYDRPELLGPAHLAIATTFAWQGEFSSSRSHAARGLSYYDRVRDRNSAWVYGLDTATGCLIDLSRSAWFLGYPDEALRRIEEAVTHMRGIGHAFSLGEALCFAAAIHLLRGEGAEALKFGQEAMKLADDYTIPQWVGAGKIAAGWAMIDLDRPAEGIALLREGVGIWKTIESGAAMPWFLALLAEGYIRTRQLPQALDALSDALRLIVATGERYYESEVHRLRGEVCRLDGNLTAAESAYRQALEVARMQGARSIELRAATGLGRTLLASRPGEALALIDPILSGFTEGFGTRDLREAKAVLGDVSRAVGALPAG
jgi:class 3 adenylate cyclase/predicted ATPase